MITCRAIKHCHSSGKQFCTRARAPLRKPRRGLVVRLGADAALAARAAADLRAPQGRVQGAVSRSVASLHVQTAA